MAFVAIVALILIEAALSAPVSGNVQSPAPTTEVFPSSATAETVTPPATTLPAQVAATIAQAQTVRAATLGDPQLANVLVAAFIFISAVVLEVFLAVLNAAFGVNDRGNRNQPTATVRAFLVGTLVVITLVFALLPNTWVSNKAAVLLFGFLTAVIGYFISRTTSGAVTRAVHLSVINEQVSGRNRVVTGKLDNNYRTVLGTPAPPIVATLLSTGGQVVGKPSTAAVDSGGSVEFHFEHPSEWIVQGNSYILHVLSPASVVCDKRIDGGR
jgi:hypothetical protein